MTTPAAPVVSCTGLERVFGTGETAVRALDGITAQFMPGQFTAIMGPSGSGKSTLLYNLAGLDQPTAGSVVVDGVEITGLDDNDLTKLRRNRLGFIFQSYNLLPTLDARDNIRLPLTFGHEKPDPDWEKTLLDALGIADRASHKPAELSGGQQQRVAIARAMISRPAVVFADEPTGALDSGSAHAVLTLMRRAVDEFGQSIVLVTHDPISAARADRVLFLADGRVTDDRTGINVDGIIDHLRATTPTGTTV